MTEKLIFNASVLYGDVDRSEVLLLQGVFKFLQEAAIIHANQFDLGSRALVTRGESWVLNRMAVAIHRYPHFEESLRIETWSRGIKSFKGYREFRVFDAQNQLLFSGSSLWLYVSIRNKSIIRVPAELASTFPQFDGGVFCPELESLEFAVPAATGSQFVPIAIRYSDVDVNLHVNNTAYLDFLQTALSRAGLPPRPAHLRIKYAKSIPAETDAVTVRLEPRGSGAVFAIGDGETIFALGEVEEPRADAAS